MSDDVYEKQSDNKYDPRFLTKLVQNFRTHPAILKVPNELFYDGDLMACADKQRRELFCNWEVSGTNSLCKLS